jgi:putative cell wall-binding protein
MIVADGTVQWFKRTISDADICGVLLRDPEVAWATAGRLHRNGGAGGMSTGMKTIKTTPSIVAAVVLLLLVCLASSVFFLMSSAAEATVLESLTLEQLAQRATSVVVAEVVEAPPRVALVGQAGTSAGMPQTYFDLQVIDVVKGTAPAGITVSVLGGELGDYRVEVDGMPVFTPGETCLLFLDAQGRVIGGTQGKLDVTDGMVQGLSQSLTSVRARIGRALPATGAGSASIAPSATVYDVVPSVESSTALLSGVGALAVPVITGINPGSAPAGTGDRVTITGTGFGTTAGSGSVKFFYRSPGQPTTTITAPIMSWSDTSIVAEVPVGTVDGYPASASSGPVTVTNSSGQISAGYDFQVEFGFGSLRWLTPVVDFRVNANTADTSQERALIDAAAAVWSAPANFAIVDVGACSTTVVNSGDGKNDIFWSSTLLPSGVIATSWTSYWDELGLIREVDICFNDTFNWGDGAGGTMDVQSIALHEMGHWLKLRDLYGTADMGKVMYGLRSYGTQTRELSSGDREGIIWIYGASGPSAPVVSAGSDATVTIGSTFSRSGSFTDPDDEGWTATVDYGDGSGPVPLTLNSGKTFSLSHLYAGTGAYTVAVTVEDSGHLSGTDTLAVTVNPTSPAYTSYRGLDRYDTAIRLSRAAYPATLPAGSGLVLAPGETFQEALCGAPLASAYGGPVLLNPKTGIRKDVMSEIRRLAPQSVFVIGYSTAIVTAIRAALPGITVTPINGTSVYDMSYRVAKALGAKVGDLSAATAVITIGTNFPDALGVAPLTCFNEWPILLTEPATKLNPNLPLHAKAAQALSELGITRTIKVGTYAPLPPGVTYSNLSGANRYVTNVNVASWARANAGLTFTHTAIATGDKFPDALAAGPYLAKDGGILLLSPLLGPLPVPIGEVITANAASVQHFTFIAMVEPVISQVKVSLP